jgi:uncharacterized protein (TIGR02266 family)
MTMQQPQFNAAVLGPTDDADERRSHPRFHLALEITLRGDNNFYTGITSDISEGGVFIATHTILKIGTPVILQFQVPRFDALIMVKGFVRWVREPAFGGSHFDDVKPGMGIQFHGLGAREAQLIRHFMQMRSPEFFD